MAKYAILKSFYASEAWIKFRLLIIAQRGPRCQHCGKIIANSAEIIIHHTIELTPANVHDVLISLNPDKVELICHECHNKVHGRFGYQNEKGIYIVYGAPLSGKTTYVRENMRLGDMVVDMDMLYKAISFQPEYIKPDNLLRNVSGVYNQLLDNVKTRYGKWNSAWIIGGYADKFKREKTADELGAELIFCNVSKDECMARLAIDESRQYIKPEWSKYIDKWFEEYVA